MQSIANVLIRGMFWSRRQSQFALGFSFPGTLLARSFIGPRLDGSCDTFPVRAFSLLARALWRRTQTGFQVQNKSSDSRSASRRRKLFCRVAGDEFGTLNRELDASLAKYVVDSPRGDFLRNPYRSPRDSRGTRSGLQGMTLGALGKSSAGVAPSHVHLTRKLHKRTQHGRNNLYDYLRIQRTRHRHLSTSYW